MTQMHDVLLAAVKAHVGSGRPPAAGRPDALLAPLSPAYWIIIGPERAPAVWGAVGTYLALRLPSLRRASAEVWS